MGSHRPLVRLRGDQAKGNNWGVNFNKFRPLWDCFMLIDEIWNRELDDMSEGFNDSKQVKKPSLMTPASWF
jgi:hypothetical protein